MSSRRSVQFPRGYCPPTRLNHLDKAPVFALLRVLAQNGVHATGFIAEPGGQLDARLDTLLIYHFGVLKRRIAGCPPMQPVPSFRCCAICGPGSCRAAVLRNACFPPTAPPGSKPGSSRVFASCRRGRSTCCPAGLLGFSHPMFSTSSRLVCHFHALSGVRILLCQAPTGRGLCTIDICLGWNTHEADGSWGTRGKLHFMQFCTFTDKSAYSERIVA